MPDAADDHVLRQLASPAGQAWQRMLKDPSFADEVAADATAALAGYDLDDEAFAALAADAPRLVPAEVQGLDQSIGRPRLKTPDLLGIGGISIGDLGSGRITGIAGGDLGSGRFKDG